MKDAPTFDLTNFFTRMDCASLGDGDITAGANTLVSMCATIAAAAGPDAAIIDGKGQSNPVGVHWLVGGSLSPVLHDELALAPLRELQNTLSRNTHLVETKFSEADKALRPKLASGAPHPEPVLTSERVVTKEDRSLLLNLLGRSHLDLYRGEGSGLLNPAVLTDTIEIVRAPLILLDGSNPKELSKQLYRSHRARPLVDFVVTSPAEAELLAPACQGIMNGCSVNHPHPLHIRGIATARLPGGNFEHRIGKGNLPEWILRMLWLVDQPWNVSGNTTDVVVLDDVRGRYSSALRSVVERRIQGGDNHETMKGFEPWQHAHVRSLIAFEPRFPGISGALLKLPATLLFGMLKILKTVNTPRGFRVSTDQITAVSDALVRRMVRQFSAVVHASEGEQRQRIASSILDRLSGKPHSDRELTRRFNRLPIHFCREVLENLRKQGRVVLRGDGKWELTREPATIDTVTTSTDVS